MTNTNNLPQIITLTVNPSLDRIMYTDRLGYDTVIRTNKVYQSAGGKGLNVSKALTQLGLENTAICVLGGDHGNKVNLMLEKDRVNRQIIWLEQETRINTAIFCGEQSMKISEYGPKPTTEEIEVIMNEIFKAIKPNQIWILAGALLPNMPNDFYITLSNKIAEVGSKTIFDTNGKALKLVCDNQPFLIKPNQEEAEQILNIAIESISDARKAVQHLLDKGVQNVALSMGEKGLVFGNKEGISYFEVPAGLEVKKTIGAGDGLLSGLIYGIVNNLPLAELGYWGVCVGSLSTTFENLKYADLETTKKLVETMKGYNTDIL
jgi:1-phosphofructokinase family hexose kinase